MSDLEDALGLGLRGDLEDALGFVPARDLEDELGGRSPWGFGAHARLQAPFGRVASQRL